MRDRLLDATQEATRRGLLARKAERRVREAIEQSA